MTPTTPRTMRWREWGKALVLLGMSLYFIVLIATGSLSNYINLRFQWLTYLAAALFLLIGVWQVWQLIQMSVPTSSVHSTHTPLTWGGLLLIFIPLITGFLIPSQPLTASAINGSVSMDSVAARTASAYVRPPEERNILEWLQEFNRVNNAAQFNGLPVSVDGFIYREPDMPEGHFMVARFTMSCCVADAFAIGMPIIDAEGAAMPEGTWVRIQGTLEAQTFRGELLPVIQPVSIEPIEVPQNPYLYS